MKPRRRIHKLNALACAFSSAIVFSMVATTPTANALTWDTVGANAAIDGGTGNWLGGATWTADGGATNVVWTDGSAAVLEGTTGTVTLTGPVSATSLTLTTDYTVTGDTLTLTGGGTALSATNNGTVNSNVTFNNAGGSTVMSGGAGMLTLGGTVDANSQALTIGGTGNTWISSGPIINGAAFQKDGIGTFFNTGASTFTAFTMNGGTVSGGSLTATTYDLNGGTVSTNLGAGTTLTQLTNTTTLNGSALASAINVNGGTLALGTSDSFSNAAVVTVASGATLNMSTFTDTVGSFVLNNGTLDGTGALTAATYALNGGTVNAQLGAGAITVDTGTTALGSAGRLNSASSLLIQGGQLTLGGAESVNSFQQTGGTLAGAFTLTSATDFDMQAGTVSSDLGGGVGLTKTTAGTTILSGTNAYTGVTAVNGGTLQVDGSTAAASTVNVGTAGTLSGTGTVNGNATLTGNGVINFGVGGNIVGTLGVTGGNWNGVGSVTGVVTSSSGTFTIGSGANLTATSGLNVTGGSIAATDATGTITGSVNYTSSAYSNFQGVIAGVGSTVTVNNELASSGGVFVLSGANTYGGLTTVTSGLLAVYSPTGTLGTNANAVVSNTGTLGLDGASITQNVQITGTGTQNFGASLGAISAYNNSTNSISGLITVVGGASIVAEAGSTLNLNGGVDKNGTTLTLTGWNAAGGIININNVGISGAAANSDLIVDGVTVNENVANTYNGPTFIRSTAVAGTGILNANAANALPTANGRTAVTMDDSGLGSSQLNLIGGFNQSAASLTGAASSLVNLNGNTLTIGAAAGTTTFAGVIDGSGGIIKDDASTQVLSGTNTYTGTTAINGGTLQLDGSTAALSEVQVGTAGTLTGSGTVNGNATLTGNGVINFGVSGNIVGTLGVTGGNWNGQGTVGGNVNVTSGNLSIGSGANMTVTQPSSVNVSGAATFSAADATGTITGNVNYTSTGNSLFQGVIAGAASTFTLNTGTTTTSNYVRLNGNNTYGGLTTVTSGALTIGHANGLGGTGAGTTVASGATLGIDSGVNVGAEALSIAGTGVDAGGVSVGALLGCTFGAGTSGYAGLITLTGNATIGANSGSTFNLTGGINTAGNTLTLGLVSPLNTAIFNVDAPITGAGGIIVEGNTTNLNASNTYTGSTSIINGGILNATVAGALPAPAGDGGTGTVRSALSMDQSGTGSSTLNLVGFNQAVASLTGAASSSINVNANTLTIGAAAGTTTFAGVIDGSGGIIKDDASTQVLSGANTYTGTTAINGGTLQLDGSTAALSEVQVGTAGTLTGSGTVNGNATLTGNGVINFGVSGNIVGTLGVTGGNWNGQGTVTGLVTSSSGSFTIGSGANLTATSGVDVTGGTIAAADATGTITGSVNYTSTSASIFQGVIAGAASTVTVNNELASSNGGLILSGVNTYGGLTTVTSGFLGVAGATATIGTNANALVSSTGTLGLTSGAAIGQNVQITGTGTQNFGASLGAIAAYNNTTSSISGLITVVGGASIVAEAGSTLSLNGGVDKNGTTLTLTGWNAPGGIININTVGISGASANSDLIVDSVTVNENVANTYNGPTFIRSTFGVGSGILNANVANALPTANGRTAVTMDDLGLGSSQLNLGASQSIASLTGAASSLVDINGNTLTIGAAAGTTTFAGVIDGSGGIIKDDASTQVLSGTNTYTGTTAINGGTLQLDGSTAALSEVQVGTAGTLTGSGTVNGNATLTGNGVINFGVSGNIVGTLGVTGGNWNGQGTVTGLVTSSSGTFTIGSGANLTATSGVAVTGGTIAAADATGTITGSMNYTSSGFSTFQGVIAGAGSTVTVNNELTNSSGGLVLSGINTYGGLTTVTSGFLAVSGATATIGANTNAVVSSTGTLGLTGGASIGQNVQITGAGTLNFGAPLRGAIYAYNSTVSAVNGAITVVGGASIAVDNGSILNLNGGINKNATTLTLTSGFNTGGIININNVGISGASANSDLIVDSVTVNENVANTYNGPTFIRSTAAAGTGILNANVANALPTANGRTAVTMDDSGLGSSQLNLGASQTIASLTGAASSLVNLNANTLTIGTSAGSTTFAGGISGVGGSLIKDSASTQVLSGVNTYTGTTTVNAGTLHLIGSITSNTTVNAGGTFRGTGTVNGNLTNNVGGTITVGTLNDPLNITGSLVTSGTIALNLQNVGNFEQIQVNGNASFNGTLTVQNTGTGLAGGEIAQIISAGSYSGSFAVFNPLGFTNAVVFNNATGQLIGLANSTTKASKTFLNLTENQTNVFLALYEDSIQLGVQNVTTVYNPAVPSYTITLSGGASNGDALLVAALNQALFTNPGTIFAPVINQLSPEVHRGMVDYTEQALRSHVRDGVDAAPISKVGRTQVFATVQTSRQGAEDAIHNADYDIDITSLTTGVRYDIDNRLQIGGLLGVDDGSIEGALIDTEAQGFVLGIFGRYLLDEASKTKLTASLSYGSFDYDATRRSYGGSVTANGISSDAIEVALGVSTVSFEKDGFRVIPNASIRFMTGSVDSFLERGPGVNLAVDEQDLNSMLLDLGVDFEYQAQENLLFVGHIGYVTDFEDSDNTVSARFAASGALASPFSVQAPGIDDEAFILGLGMYYDINSAVRVGLTYRGEYRLNSESSQSIGIGASFGF